MPDTIIRLSSNQVIAIRRFPDHCPPQVRLILESPLSDQAITLPEHRWREIFAAMLPETTPPQGDVQQYAPTPKKLHDYATTQIDLSVIQRREIESLCPRIAETDLCPCGREEEPHITVLYGIDEENASGSDISMVAYRQGRVHARITGVGYFPAGKVPAKPGDAGHEHVSVIAILDSADLARLRTGLKRSVPNTQTFNLYLPHITLGYVKPGCEDKYGLVFAQPTEQEYDYLVYSRRDGSRDYYPLGSGGQISYTAP